ncbi:serine/threonine-protein kinase [Nannocystis pusilla]|uniref:Serine/threonine protein kinase n=1 Tax=Nannocystis pusilla TaxID=889268 RepID=A0ABS7TNV0_9BACT|nr:serine/threonine-protein kinase [Nannocystis pusilla]MBZ5709880.1 serine/threonine protein kinase [Nannocystis pusilla]
MHEGAGVSAIEIPTLPAELAAGVLGEPERVGSELRCRVRFADGREGVLAWLAPELARDAAMRRRYVRDVARLRELDAPRVASVLASGPADPRAPGAEPPWRLRLDPRGETLEQWLRRRAAVPVDEAVALAIALCELLTGLHARGVVIRDLHPRLVVRADDGLWLTDVGLARVDILSTRTASSLLLEGSPYAAPEQLARTALDPRADLYAVGVILYRALTGLLPRGEGPAFLGEASPAPPRALRAEVPPELDALVMRCLALEPAARPASARELAAALAGEGSAGASQARTICQHCGARLRLGQRLCLACGRVGVQFEHAPGGTCAVDLRGAKEDAEFFARLTGELQTLAEGEVPVLNLVIGDARMYSKAELERRHALPLRLFSDLSPETAERLRARLAAAKLQVAVVERSPRATRRLAAKTFGWTLGTTAVVAGGAALLGAPSFVPILLGALGIAVAFLVFIAAAAAHRKDRPTLLRLRAAPAALPASDPLVARLAGLLARDTAPEVREIVGELALAVQRLVDHRAAAPGARAELDMIAGSLAPLVELIARQVERLREIDASLATLEEGALVRALATSEARREPPERREELLLGLDRLRALEDERAAAFHRLLEAEHLLRRAVELGLEVRDDAVEHERRVAQALHELGGE